MILRAALSLLPVLSFLALLLYLDSYKLVRIREVVGVIAAGCMAAVAAWLVNVALVAMTGIERSLLTRFAVPAIEECLKAIPVFLLLRHKRVGFLVDAAIFGFSVGTGFALVENLYYIAQFPNAHPLLSVVRGFGTAVMHGGTTAIFGMVAKSLAQQRESEPAWIFPAAVAVPFALHSAFNQFLLPPVISAACVIVVLPLVMLAVFAQSEKYLRAWLGRGFDVQADLLNAIGSGQFTESRPGRYLQTLRDRFEGPVVADMLCFIRMKAELSLQAKGVLILRQNGLPVPHDEELTAKLEELQFLRRSIGRTGELALAPILYRSSEDAWELRMLSQAK